MPLTSRTSTVGTASAMIDANDAIRVRMRTIASTIAASPVSSDGTSISPGLVTTCQAFARANEPTDGAPLRSGICPNTMFAATPVRKPVMTETETKRV